VDAKKVRPRSVNPGIRRPVSQEAERVMKNDLPGGGKREKERNGKHAPDGLKKERGFRSSFRNPHTRRK